MTRVFKQALLAGLCLLAGSWLLRAAGPKFWELITQEDLIKGRLRGVSLSSDGKLMLAPQYESIFETGQGLVFSLAADPSSNLYLGTGHEGRVFKIDPKGAGSLFFKAEEIDVFALACDIPGNIFVASSPDGKVYKVGSNGKGTQFFDPKDKYIWDLIFDKEGNLYVATGGKGLLYRVDKAGASTVLFDSDEAHLMSLAFDLEGNIIAGSAPSGLVYRVSKEGKAFVLLDTPLAEVRRVAVDRLGNIYAAALATISASGAGSHKEADVSPSPPRMRTIQSGSDAAISADAAVQTGTEDRAVLPLSIGSSAAGAQEKSAAKSMIYRINKDGTSEKLWSSNSDMVFDFVVRDDGKILAGTGTRGRILAIDPQRSYTILTESGDEHVTRLLTQGPDAFATTSNLGKLYRLQPVRARSGEYESDVFDAGMPSSWGQITWKVNAPAGITIEVYTRSGNTSVQSKTWSDWAGPYLNKAGEPIRSPLARYLQWKVVFKNSGTDRKLLSTEDAVEGLIIPYLQQNARPQFTSISVLPPGVALQKIPSVPASGGVVSVSAMSDTGASPTGSALNARGRFRAPPRRVLKPGTQSFSWKATDENDDDLLYEIYFKGENETEWKLLEKELEDDFYTIDSNALPAGGYTVKIVASDAPSNPYGRFFTGEIISKPFVINNSAPVIEVIRNETKGRRVEITYRARDAATKIHNSEFSLDGGQWHLLFPKDGIADSRDEEYVLLTPEMTAGEHVVGLRVADAVGNVGTFKLIVKIP